MAQAKLNKTAFQLQFKQGLAADINTTTTKNLAVEGEPHWATDTNKLYVFDGSENVRIHGLDLAIINNGDVITHNDEIVYASS